jgi:chromosomal replication initiation ATPase DnaA
MSRAYLHSRICNAKFQPTINEVVQGIADEIQSQHPTTIIKAYIRTPYRGQEVVMARQIAMTLAHRICKKRLVDTAQYFDRDHATVIHARKQVANRQYNPELLAMFEVAHDYCARQGWIHANLF